MKKSILLFSFFLLGLSLFGQEIIDKTNVEVLGHKFSVGDTIQLATGKMPDGDYVSIVVSPKGFNSYHFPSGGEGMKFAINKIKTINNGAEILTCLIIKNGISDITVIANDAITNKEILLK